MKRMRFDDLDSEKLLVIDADFCVQEEDTVFIVCLPTNVIYNVQTGGIACKQSRAEGIVINLKKCLQELNSCAYGCWGGEQFKLMDRTKQAENLDILLQTYDFEEYDIYRLNKKIKFNWTKLEEFQENWWPVLISVDDFDEAFRNRGKREKGSGVYYQGYICPGNCD